MSRHKTKKESNWLITLVVIGGIGYGGYKLIIKKRLTETVTEISQVNPPAEEKKEIPVDDGKILAKNEVSNLVVEKKCNEALIKWCQMLGMKDDLKEGFTVKGVTLVGFINFNSTAPSSFPEEFKKLSSNKQREILLLKRTLRREFLNPFRRNNNWSNVQVIGFDLVDEKIQLRSLIKIKRVYNLEKFSASMVNGALNESFNFGNADALSLINENYEIVHFPETSGLNKMFTRSHTLASN